MILSMKLPPCLFMILIFIKTGRDKKRYIESKREDSGFFEIFIEQMAGLFFVSIPLNDFQGKHPALSEDRY